MKDGDIVIKETDKSHKFCVNSVEKGKDHIGSDKQVSRDDVKKMEKRINKNTKCILGFLRAGEDLGKTNEFRVRSAYCAETGIVLSLGTHVKDHKPPPEDPMKGIPKSKGTCLAWSSINTRFSDVLSDIIVPMISKKKRQNVKSTEELLNKMEAAAVVIKERSSNLVIASMDFVGLYPNLDIRKSACRV